MSVACANPGCRLFGIRLSTRTYCVCCGVTLRRPEPMPELELDLSLLRRSRERAQKQLEELDQRIAELVGMSGGDHVG